MILGLKVHIFLTFLANGIYTHWHYPLLPHTPLFGTAGIVVIHNIFQLRLVMIC